MENKMGCDIHIVLERKYNNKWIGITDYSTNPYHLIRENDKFKFKWYCNLVTMRNYRRFAALAGVRGNGPEPKGIPVDISDLSLMIVNYWESDGHSHSFMSLKEASKILIDTLEIKDNEWDEDSLKMIKECSMMVIFGIDDDNLDDNLDDYRIVFWFDN